MSKDKAPADQSKTAQENFWAGEFGDAYTDRNRGASVVASNVEFFKKALTQTQKIESVIEFGANIGLNMQAIRQLYPSASLSAVEINQKAVKELEKISGMKVYARSLFDFSCEKQFDLAFYKGVLIHLNPDKLPDAYDVIFNVSRRYILIAEYYNPTPMEVPYRGHKGVLFKRDFAGELMDRHKELKLLDCGFAYHRDPTSPQDDITWFLMEKKKG